jgi:uncharacterized protein
VFAAWYVSNVNFVLGINIFFSDQLPNVDVTTGVRDNAVPYKILLKFRIGKDPVQMSKPCFGVNGVPLGAGIVRVGDVVHVREWTGPGGI